MAEPTPPPGFAPVEAAAVAPPPPPGFAPVQAESEWKPTEYGFKVKPIDLGGGKSSVQREGDLGVYFGQEQGNAGEPGWFNERGIRLGGTPTTGPGALRQLADTGVTDLKIIKDSLVDAPSTKIEQGANYLAGKFGLRSPQEQQTVSDQIRARLAAVEQLKGQVYGGDVLHALAPMAIPVGRLVKTGMTAAEGAPVVLDAAAKTLASVARAKDAGLIGAGVAASQPVTEGQEFAPQLATQTATGYLLGATVPRAVEEGVIPAVSWVGNKAANAISGTKLGDLLGIKMKVNPRWEGAPALADELESKGITKASLGDVTGNPAHRRIEDRMAVTDQKFMESRMDLNKQGLAYADRVVADLKRLAARENWQSLGDVRKAAAAGGKRADGANALLTAIERSGDDWQEIAQQSGNLKLFLNKLKADQLYDHAEKLASKLGDVPVSNYRAAVARSVKDLGGNTGAEDSAETYMGKLLNGVKPKQVGTPAEADVYGTTIKQATEGAAGGKQDLTFSGLRRLRSSIQERIRGLQEGTVVGTGDEVGHLKAALKGLDRDLDTFGASNGPDMAKAYRTAADHYRTAVVPYKEAAFGRALASNDPKRLVNILNNTNPKEQARLFALLDPKGQANVQAGLIEAAVDAGEKTARGVEGVTFSAAQVASKLEKLQQKGTLDVVFSGETREALRGMARILRTIDRSDTIAFNPPTGGRMEGVTTGKGDLTVLGLADKARVWLNGENLRKLHMDPRGKGLLIRANSIDLNSPAGEKLLTQEIPKFLGFKGSAANVQPFTPAAAGEPDPTVAKNR